MIISKYALVKISSRNKTYYQQLGYNCNIGDTLEVPFSHLSKSSASIISIQCDYCNKTFDARYADYVTNKGRTIVNKDCCRNCQPLKAKDVAMIKYGVPHTSHLEEVKEKRSASLMEHYGVDNASKSDEIKEKIKNTMYQNGNVPTSKQQLEIFQMLSQEGYDVKLNYPVDKYSLDVALFYCGLKIDIEYDGWYWHQDKHKDAVRNGVLINNFGWKVIRVKGGNLLPDIKELKNAIETVAETNLNLYSIKLDDWKEINNNESEEINYGKIY